MATVYAEQGKLNVLFELTDDSGVAIQLLSNGYDVGRMQVRDRPDALEVLFDAVTGTPGAGQGLLEIEPVDLASPTGIVRLTADADVMGAMQRGGVFDCLVWKSVDSGDVLVAAEGTFALRRGVTKR